MWLVLIIFAQSYGDDRQILRVESYQECKAVIEAVASANDNVWGIGSKVRKNSKCIEIKL